MTPEEIPQEVMDLFNKLAGKIHRSEGSAVAALAEILTLYDEIRADASKQWTDAKIDKLIEWWTKNVTAQN